MTCKECKGYDICSALTLNLDVEFAQKCIFFRKNKKKLRAMTRREVYLKYGYTIIDVTSSEDTWMNLDFHIFDVRKEGETHIKYLGWVLDKPYRKKNGKYVMKVVKE